MRPNFLPNIWLATNNLLVIGTFAIALKIYSKPGQNLTN